tara:strand:+ start:11613 stop:12065 length:453 start_codon:yes stop_codon:yes gene_type:complete
MNTKYLFCFIALFLLGYSCSQTNKTASNANSSEINYGDLNLNKGKNIVQTVCITCHDPKASVSDRIAPPLEIVKRNYLATFEKERDFISSITNFIMHPTEEQARLHADIEENGLMDPLGYSEQEIQSVAMFIYRTNLERPDWLSSEDDPD